MGRRQARETALQALFQVDVGGINIDSAIKHTADEMCINNEDLKFTRELVEGTVQHLGEIDAVISKLSRDWQINRIANVDKNIMRLALFEIFFREDIPPSVSVNEAVEMAKIFGGVDSRKFVNGILGKVVQDTEAYKPSL